MLIRMIRTQTGELGTLHAGVAYHVEPRGPRKKERAAEVAHYLALGFAETVTEKELAAAKAAAEKIPAPSSVRTKGSTAALAEKAAAEKEAAEKAAAEKDADGK